MKGFTIDKFRFNVKNSVQSIKKRKSMFLKCRLYVFFNHSVRFSYFFRKTLRFRNVFESDVA